jgi:hypothetical protein
MSGFGRKGLAAGATQPTPGQAMAMRAMPMAPAGSPHEAVSPQLAAFLAAEREGGNQVEGGLSDIAVSTPNIGSRTAGAGGRGGGSDMRPALPGDPRSDRSMPVTYLLWWFLGIFGAHRFYLRAYKSGACQAALMPLLVIIGMVIGGTDLGVAASTSLVPLWFVVMLGWWLVDAFLIPGMTRRANGSRPELAFT